MSSTRLFFPRPPYARPPAWGDAAGRLPALRPGATGRRRGVTLVEISIVSVLLLIVLGATYGVMLAGNDAYNTGSLLGHLTERSRKASGQILAELRNANIMTVTSTAVVFQVPVDWDGDGDFVDPDGELEWGMIEANNQHVKYATASYLFESAGTLTETQAGRDLNKDDDMNDAFELGRIVRETEGGMRDPVIGQAIRHSTNGDMNVEYDSDRDGNPANANEDVLFTRTLDGVGLTLQVYCNIWTYGRDGRGRHIFAHVRSGAWIRNPQQ